MNGTGRSERVATIDAIRVWLEGTQIVPAALARYESLITDGLVFFLERLPAERLATIVEDQLAMAADASSDERLVALLRRCPTLHKLGQVVAHEAGLPLALRTRLASLESIAPAPGLYDIVALVERELGDIRGLTVAPDALAEGSVAVVVPFTWDGAPPGVPRSGVFKTLKPQAEQHLAEDLAIWPELGTFLEERSAAAGLPSLDFRTTLDGVAALLASEVRLDREQERLVWAHAFYADSPRVQIPRLVPLCTPRITAMERIAGRKITASGAGAAHRRMLAQTLVEALLAKPFWSEPAARPVFHADPHAGNLFATDDGRVAIFDWALTTTLSQTQLAAVVGVLLAAATLDESGVMRALADLGEVRDERRLRATVASAIAEVRRGAFPGFRWLTPLLDSLARHAIVAFPQETALFRKSLLTLGGVVRDVAPHVSIDEIVLRSGASRFLGESPLRTLASFESRAFGTHVSNGDLVRFLMSASLTPARYTIGTYAELLGVGAHASAVTAQK